MQYSFSRVSVFEKCKFKYKMQYVDGIKTLPNTDADNALILGAALHTGIEKEVQTAIKEYYMSYPIITDNHVNEAIKLEHMIPKAKMVLPQGQYEVSIIDSSFIGFIDLLAPATVFESGVTLPDTYDIYDFKYSNNISQYLDSAQLHLYKYFFEKGNPGKCVRNLYFVFVPKVGIRQKQSETLYQFRQRLTSELNACDVSIRQIEYKPDKVIEWLFSVKAVLEEKNYDKNPSKLCRYCEYEGFCMKGYDYMLIPKKCTRKDVSKITKRKVWIYGAPFSGKTTMLDDAPNPINLNTDGNTQQVTMFSIPIKDKVEVEGRRTVRTFGWEIFKEAILELEKKDNDYQTIIIDLLEDTREMCRQYMYNKNGIEHESDSAYGKGWDMIKTEYLSVIKRFFNLDYENLIVVSHEDISKDITKKNGQNITRIAPNIQEALANKIAGMVDIVARVVVEDDGSRTLNFKTDEVTFGGGRLKGITKTQIPLSWEALTDLYDEIAESAAPSVSATPKRRTAKGKTAAKATEIAEADVVIAETLTSPATEEEDTSNESEGEVVSGVNAVVELSEDDVPTKRTRRTRTTETEIVDMQEAVETESDTDSSADTDVDEKPVRRTRRRRGE